MTDNFTNKTDACVFVGESLYGSELSLDDIIRRMDLCGVSKAVIRPNKPCDYCYERANEKIAEIVVRNSRFIGFGRLNPLEKTAIAQLEKIKALGLRGVHLHPWEDNFVINDTKFDEFFAAAARLNLPVYVSAGYPRVSEPLQMYECAIRNPNVIFIATHGAQLDISGMSFDDATYSARAENLWYDLSGIYRRDFIENLAAAAGEDRLVFGSCTPYMDIRLETDRVNAAQIPTEVKEKIFSGNISRLLNV